MVLLCHLPLRGPLRGREERAGGPGDGRVWPPGGAALRAKAREKAKLISGGLGDLGALSLGRKERGDM